MPDGKVWTEKDFQKKKNLDFLKRVVEVVEGRGRTAPLTPAPRAGPLAPAITSPQESYLFADFTEEDLAGLGYNFTPGLFGPTAAPSGQPGEGQPPGEPGKGKPPPKYEGQAISFEGFDYVAEYPYGAAYANEPGGGLQWVRVGRTPKGADSLVLREIGGRLYERQDDGTFKDVTPPGAIKAEEVTEDTYRVTNADGSVNEVTYLLDESGRFQKDEVGKPVISRTVTISPAAPQKAKRPLTGPGPETYADPQGNTWRKTWEWDRESEQYIPQETLIESAGDFETRQQRARQLQEDLYLTREREAREGQGKYNALAYALSQMQQPGEEGAAPLLQRPGGLQETLRRILSQGGVFPGEINRQAGVEAPYIDTPRGRIFGGTQEYNQLIQAGARPTFQGSIGKLGQVGAPNYWEWQRMLPSQRAGLESSYEGMGVPRGDIGASIEGAFEAQRQTTYNPEIGKFWGEFMRRQEEEKRQREMASLGAVERRRSPFWQR